jgi:ankyrin repeat protein
MSFYKKTFLALAVIYCLLLLQTTQAQSTSLMEAVRNNSIQEVKNFVKNNADLNAYDDDSDHVLMKAAIYASADCMRILMENKANPNLKNKHGQTALIRCANDINKMKLLLKYGANNNDTSKSGISALLVACSGYGMYENVKWLINNGADVRAKRWNA